MEVALEHNSMLLNFQVLDMNLYGILTLLFEKNQIYKQNEIIKMRDNAEMSATSNTTMPQTYCKTHFRHKFYFS